MRVFLSMPSEHWTEDETASEEELMMQRVRALLGSETEKVRTPERRQLNGHHPVYALAVNLQMMCQADAAVFHPDWWISRDCCMEWEICGQYGIRRIDLQAARGEGRTA